jgi:iron complex outermembrane receptor protein
MVKWTALGLGLVLIAEPGFAQQPDSSVQALKALSLEQLMNIDVTSVSKRPEKLSGTASAIQVITGEEIRRSGATSLAEALRLAPNLQVAQVNSSQWAVSARGFDNVLANKLLVLIDGRTVYTPLYAGVFWDVQNPPLETIDRIEVISGPGGALWGANAVNGVINVITKGAAETTGWSVEGAGGTEVRGMGEVRYGARLGSALHGRFYGEGFSRGSTDSLSGADARDDWHLWQGGLRLDWAPKEDNTFIFKANAYDGRPDPDGNAPVVARGGSASGRWSRTVSPRSDLQLQVYYDRTYRDFGNGFTEDLATYDADFQHRFQVGGRHVLIWGVGARIMDHATQNLPLFGFLPSPRWLHLYSGFVQDEITLVPERARLILGSKVEHNDYTGFEIQPNARLAWTPSERHTVWAAVSRAVRTPSRLDRDFELFADSVTPIIARDNFQSEELVAYELGWRFEPAPRVSLSLSTYYNVYDNVRSVEPDSASGLFPLTFQNGVHGHSDGVELAATYQLSDRWRLRGGYTFLKKTLSLKPGSQDLNAASAESDDPAHQALVQSSVDLPGRIEWDVVLRYVDVLPKPLVPSYVGLDVRLGWRLTEHLQLAVTGQNLLDDQRAQFKPSGPARRIARGVYGMITWR